MNPQDQPTLPMNPDGGVGGQPGGSLPPYVSPHPSGLPGNVRPPIVGKQGVPKDDLSWKDRTIFQNVTQFGPDPTDGFVIIVMPQAVKKIQEGTRRAFPNEAYGRLIGRTYQDNRGVFTLVSECVYPTRLNATPENFELSAEQMNELRRMANQLHPTADSVGWTHSHRVYSGYSKVDKREQEFWKEYGVGILTFMRRGPDEPWARAYRGPKSRELPLQMMSVGFDAIGVSDGSDEDTSRTQDTVVSHRPDWLTATFFSVMILLLLVAISIFYTTERDVLSLTAQISQLEKKVSALSTPASGAPTNFLWNCNAQSGVAPLKVTCNGPVGPNIEKWSLDFGDGNTLETSSVSHIYQKPGTYNVALTITVGNQKQALGSLKVVVNAAITQSTAKG
jgi:proteasome lid subunit RPN8/RPN11